VLRNGTVMAWGGNEVNQLGEHEHVLARHGPDVPIRLMKIGKGPMID
jgi:hypothetical protein